MSLSKFDMLPLEIRQPTAPQPIDFHYRSLVDWRQLEHCRTPERREQLFMQMKRAAAHALADHIARHAKWFEIDIHQVERPGELVLELELTISDFGAYHNYLPVARREGENSGWERAMKAATASLPYGLGDAATEFYE